MGDINNRQSININNSSDVSMGNIENKVTVTGGDAERIKEVFAELQKLAGAVPDEASRTVAQTALKTLEDEAMKGDSAQETTVQSWINFLAGAAPDIAEVAIDTFVNPVKGFSTIIRKVAERAKASRQGK